MNKLRFYLNKKLDEKMVEAFLNIRRGGIAFGEGIIRIHPQLKPIRLMKDIKQKRKAIRSYINAYYLIHRPEMVCKLRCTRDAWRKCEQKYIEITEKFFGGFQFPKGKYIAYASIINCNPRFLDSKTFQFFYKKSTGDAIYTIAHELLHFIFFDFVKKKLGKEVKQLSEDQLWNFSEIFNVVVLGSYQYRQIIDQKFVIAYPKHQQYIKQFQKAYENSQNAEEFIRKGIAIIKDKFTQ